MNTLWDPKFELLPLCLRLQSSFLILERRFKLGEAMSKPGEVVEEIPPPPKGDSSNGKTTPIDGTSKDSRVENSPLSLSNSSSKEGLTSSRKKSSSPKAVKWLHPPTQMKRLMLHPKKKPRARKEEREIRDPITMLPLTMIIYITLMPSLW
jgi:hypothetical protein